MEDIEKYIPTEFQENYIEFGDFINSSYKNVKVPEYELWLCSIIEEPIAELYHITDFKLTKHIVGVNEMSFSVPKFIAGKNGVLDRPNPLFDIIEGNKLVKLNQSEFYILSKPKIERRSDGIIFKSIKGYSREYELTQRIMDGYEGSNRMIYDITNTIDEKGIELGILNYIENNTSWKVGYVNTDISKKRRTVNFNNSNMYKVIKEIQKMFGCIILCDTIKKEINVFHPDQIGRNQGVYISDENYINELTQEVEDENITTRLYLYGNNGISVQSLTIAGQPYIEDYSYFRNTKFMSQGLLDGLDARDKVEKELENVFNVYITKIKQYTESNVDITIEKRKHETELSKLEHEWDLAITKGDNVSSINSKIQIEKDKIQNLKNAYDRNIRDIQHLQKQLNEIKNKLNLSNFLTEEQLKEFDYFIKEDKFLDNNYMEDNLEQLLEDGKEMLSKLSKPKLTFDVSVDDFMSMAQGRFIWSRFILGDIINLEHKGIGFDYQVKLIGYTHIPDERSLKLEFSSIDSIYDNSIYIERVLEDAIDTISTVDFNQFNWDKAEYVENKFSDYISNSLNLANQALAKEKGQKPILDDRGLWLYTENPDGTVSPEQIRAINNVIAITKDNWNTVEWALTPDGIMANKLVGDIILGTDLKIVSDSGIVEIMNNLIQIKDNNGRLRVALGNYADGKYGLQIKDKEGRTTVLDEDGMLQAWQEGRTDNVDSDHGLKLFVFVPKNTRSIYNAILRFQRSRFRSYSDTASSGGGIYASTEDGGGIRDTTEDGGEIRDTTKGGGGVYEPTGLATDVQHAYDWVEPGGEDKHQHKFRYVIHHKHKIEIDEHRHRIELPDHYHRIRIDPHVHEIDIDEHIHDIKPVIHESGYAPSRISVRINGRLRFTNLSSDRDNLNITEYLEIGQWNEIELTANGLGRIDATVFVQALINFDKED